MPLTLHNHLVNVEKWIVRSSLSYGGEGREGERVRGKERERERERYIERVAVSSTQYNQLS